jgi:glycosyltransferase involved in cell wall biosynthesis
MQYLKPITLLMPVKNGEIHLKKSMKFLTDNCGANDEILVVNDNSTDNTFGLLKEWEKNYPNVKVINSLKSGLVNALNLGISNSANDWIARFDVDDSYPSNRIIETRKSINSGAVCIFTDYKFTTSDGLGLGVMPSGIYPDFTYLSLVTSQRTAHPSVCFNKIAALDVGGYKNEDFPAEDISLWLRISKMGQIISIPQVLLKYRIGGSSVTGSMRKKVISKKNDLFLNFIFDKFILEKCITNLNETKFLYSKEILGKKRFLLHLRDLLFIYSLPSNRNSSSLAKIQRKILMDLNSYPLAGNLFLEAALRKTYRLI